MGLHHVRAASKYTVFLLVSLLLVAAAMGIQKRGRDYQLSKTRKALAGVNLKA